MAGKRLQNSALLAAISLVSRMIDKGLITKDDSEKLAPELTNFTRQNSDEKHTKSDVKITSLL